MGTNAMEHEMRSKEHVTDWNLAQRAATLLLAGCLVLLALLTTVTWFYLAAMSRDTALAAAAQAESARALLASNARLDAIRGELNSELIAIRDELNALNEKASVAAMPTLLPSGNSQQ
jgi:hypothetical protein